MKIFGDQPLGGKKYPLTTEQFKELYKTYTKGILTEQAMTKTRDMILDLENMADLTDLVQILTSIA